MCVEYLLIGTHFFGEENNNKQTNQPPPPPPQKERKKERKPLNNQIVASMFSTYSLSLIINPRVCIARLNQEHSQNVQTNNDSTRLKFECGGGGKGAQLPFFLALFSSISFVEVAFIYNSAIKSHFCHLLLKLIFFFLSFFTVRFYRVNKNSCFGNVSAFWS